MVFPSNPSLIYLVGTSYYTLEAMSAKNGCAIASPIESLKNGLKTNIFLNKSMAESGAPGYFCFRSSASIFL